MRIFLLSILAFLWTLSAFPQGNVEVIDSLKERLQKVKAPEKRLDLLDALAFEYIFYSYENAIKYAKASEKLARQINNPMGVAQSYNIRGITYRIQGNYAQALDYHLKALNICEDNQNLQGQANNYSNIGLVYFDKGNYKKALKYFQKALEIKERIGDERGVAFSLNDIGKVHFENNEYDKAMKSYLRTVEIRERMHDKQGIATSYYNIGKIYFAQRNFNKALFYFEKSFVIGQKYSDQTVIASSLNGIGDIKIKQEKYKKADEYYSQALSVAQTISNKIEMKHAYQGLALSNSNLEKFDKAYIFLKKYNKIKEALYDEENSKRIASLQLNYEIEKKDKEIALHKVEIRKRTVLMFASIIGFVLIVLFAYILYRANRLKRKANALLQEQKDEIEGKNIAIHAQKEALEEAFDEINEKNEAITSSIRAALNIQKAILPFDEEFNRLFPSSFVLYKPKDIVSGDFYWVSEVEQYRFVAAIDCTGHGVPGAFMSMIGNSLLNKIVNEDKVLEPKDILAKLHLGVRTRLKQSSSRNTDGMDVCLCRLENNTENSKITELVFAGAKRPLFYIKMQDINSVKGDRKSIGGFQKETIRTFSQTTLELEKQTRVYLSSDGFADQNNPKRKKFGIHNFENTLKQCQYLPIQQQKAVLETALDQHQKDALQRDDILVIGIEV